MIISPTAKSYMLLTDKHFNTLCYGVFNIYFSQIINKQHKQTNYKDVLHH